MIKSVWVVALVVLVLLLTGCDQATIAGRPSEKGKRFGTVYRQGSIEVFRDSWTGACFVSMTESYKAGLAEAPREVCEAKGEDR